MLRLGLRPSVTVNDLDRVRLAQSGVNTLTAQRQSSRQRGSLRTLLPESGAKSDWRSLGARRMALFLMSSIERGRTGCDLSTADRRYGRRCVPRSSRFLRAWRAMAHSVPGCRQRIT